MEYVGDVEIFGAAKLKHMPNRLVESASMFWMRVVSSNHTSALAW